MVRHIQIIAGLHGFWAFFQLFTAAGIGLLFLLLGGGLGALGASVGEDEMMIMGALYGTVGAMAGLMSAMMSIPGFLAAWGIFSRRPWGRVLGLFVSALACISFPMGTLIGIYSLVVLLDRDVAAAFEQGGS